MPGLGPDLCHDRGLALPRPWDSVGVTVALGVPSVIGTGKWQGYESTPVADIAVNRHHWQSSISGLESLIKYFEVAPTPSSTNPR